MGGAWTNYRTSVIKEIERMIKNGIDEMAYDRNKEITYRDIAETIFDLLHPEACLAS